MAKNRGIAIFCEALRHKIASKYLSNHILKVELKHFFGLFLTSQRRSKNIILPSYSLAILTYLLEPTSCVGT